MINGRIAITLSAGEKTNHFKMSWTEAGGPIVQEPKRRSSGTRLINRLADPLHGKAQLRYERQGIVYELDAPLAALRKVAS